jgi:hypothetical protein
MGLPLPIKGYFQSLKLKDSKSLLKGLALLTEMDLSTTSDKLSISSHKEFYAILQNS